MPAQPWKDLVSGEQLDLAFKQRSKKVLVEKVDLSLVGEYEKNRYVKISTTTKKARMEYKKTRQELFEDRVWRLLKRLNFTHMNMNDNFGIPFTDDDTTNPKQIDVFAYDGKIALVIECKQADVDDNAEQKSADFKPDIQEIRGNMDYQTKIIKSHFENDSLDVGFVFFTNKYKVSDSNTRLAKNYGISVLNEYDLAYYEKMYSVMKDYAKTQILCDVFRGQEVNAIGCEVPAIKGNLGDYEVYTFMIRPVDLVPLSYVAHKKINGNSSGAYQRIITKKRLEKIREYITDGGYFSNNIIINIDSDSPIFTSDEPEIDGPQRGTLKLPPKYQAAYVIDGQHRLYGYVGTKEYYTSYIPVTAFYNLESYLQSKIFVDINNNQKRVNANLLIKVNSESKKESDKDKEWTLPMCLQAVEDMSKEQKNPLFNQIKDEYDPHSNGIITLRALESGFKRSYLIGRNYDNKYPFLQGPLYSFSADDPKDETYKKVKTFLTKVYNKLKNTAPSQWDSTNRENFFLLTNNGFESLMAVLYELIQANIEILDTPKMSAESIFSKIERYVGTIGEAFEKMSQIELQAYKKRIGYTGIDICEAEMLLIVNNKFEDFCPKKLSEYKEKTNKKYTEDVTEYLPDLEEKIIEAVKTALDMKYQGDMKWYRTKEFKEIAHELNSRKFEDDNEDSELTDYIKLDDAYNIIEKSNWIMFGPIFGVKNPKGRTKEERTSWISDLKTYSKKIRDYQKINVDEYNRFIEIKNSLERQFSSLQEGEDDVDVYDSD